MDFSKKRTKNGVQMILTEKEYKWASLQAITNETVKENSGRRIKELIQEINAHLADLRSIHIENDDRSEKKRQELIKLFEGCLFKLAQSKQGDEIFLKLNSQLEDIRKQCNNAIQERNVAELKKLSARAEGNLQVLKNLDKSNDKAIIDDYAQLTARYEDLYNTIKKHFNSERISRPMSTQEYLKLNDNNSNDMGPSGNKLQIKDEIEKVIQQKRTSQILQGNLNSNAVASVRHPVRTLNELPEELLYEEVGIASSNREFEKHTVIKQSDSFKSDGQRTPSQIKKIFSCISPSVNDGSIEDLSSVVPARCSNAPKTPAAESSSFTNRLKEFQSKEYYRGQSASTQRPDVNTRPKKMDGTEKMPLIPVRKNVPIGNYENVQLQKPKPPLLVKHPAYMSKYDRNSDPVKPPLLPKKLNTSDERRSLNDKVEPAEKLPADYIMTVTQSSAHPVEPTSEGHSLSTFRTSSDMQDAKTEPVKQEHQKRSLRWFGHGTGRSRRPYRDTITGERYSLMSEFEVIVRDIELAIRQFKGLKYDSEYEKMDKKLAKYYCTIEDYNEYSSTDDLQKEILLRRLRTASDDLKNRIVKNEVLLRDILEEQVTLIAAHYNITR
ncbi:uncharacterized protein LOC143194859 isoform X1 [Rhynchophorus ferrugineus]|uniref:uncharacterized protein LOC143194859 isoform X1 n=1 Tax=Rhynchophorus ferrugineus TaxID=354439 RepID=UPI003FCEB2AC